MNLVPIMGAALCLSSSLVLAQVDAQQLASDVARNERRARQQGPIPWMYLLHRDQVGKSETLRVVHSRDGPVYRVLSRNGQPLNADQQHHEEQRLRRLLTDRDQQEKKGREYRHDVSQALEMLRVLPDACRFRLNGKSGPYLRLEFEPNSRFQAHTRIARFAHVLRGTMLVHPTEKRLVELKAILAEDVKFGGGFLGRIQKGGTFQFGQKEVSPGQWVVSLIDVNLKGKVLLFHNISKQQHWVFSDFERIPENLTLAQAVQMLSEPRPLFTPSSIKLLRWIRKWRLLAQSIEAAGGNRHVLWSRISAKRIIHAIVINSRSREDL